MSPYIRKCVFLLAACLALPGVSSYAQDLSVRNNLVWDAAGALNAGVEYPIGRRISVGGNVGFKSWPRFLFWDTEYVQNTTHWKHLLVAPEFRYYLDQVYDGWFGGVDLIYTHYNVGNVRFPFGLYPDVADHRVQGDFFGGGLFMGYSWWIGSHWRIEAEAGLGVGLAAYDKFECEHCGTRLGEESKLALVPKLGLNIAYNVRERHKWVEPVSQIDTVRLIRPLLLVTQVKEIAQASTTAGTESRSKHWVSPLESYRTIDEIINAPADSIRYVLFPLDSITLFPDFAGNAPVLEEILDVSRKIIADGRDSLALIQIVGLASVEGEWKHNKWLGEGRAQALKNYVMRELDLQESQVEAAGRGEAWPWFRNQVQALLPDGGKGITANQAQWLLDLIDGEPDPDKREKKIKAEKSLYRALKSDLLRDQRNSGYVHIYFKTRPDQVAAEMNALNTLIKAHRWDEVVSAYENHPEYMERTRTDAEARNAYGIALLGQAVELERIDTLQAQRARGILQEALEMGSDCARGNLEGMDEFVGKYKEYVEQKRSQEAMKEAIENEKKRK